ncbi:MAG TPA: hypothetical protein HPQ00_11270, partial [Magnetococcales bacterium]|nr:hypothetical protein [Magnetococcales bacterium]
MAILRQNRHRPDPPERKSPTKRQRGAAIRKKPLQRSQASRISGAVSVSRRKEGSLVQRLLGALMPSGPSQRPPAVRTPPPSSSEGMAPFQRERKSLLDRLLRGTKGPNDRRMFKTKPAEPRPRRENLS